jgi:nucleoside-diphosphate-sugar epimerase
MNVTGEPSLEGRTLAVTGAGGFIGSSVCRRASQQGAEVIGLERDLEAVERARLAGADTVVEGDLLDRDAVRTAVSGADLIVHTAANVREWGSMVDFIEVNVNGTANVLDAAPKNARILHLSSVVVYGYDDPETQDERAYLRSVGIPYVDTKSASDRLARERGAVVIRPGDVYGPGSVPWVERPLQLMKRRILAVPENSWMLPIFVDDLVEAIMLGLESGQPGEAYTAWSGERITFAEYFDRLASAAGLPAPRRLPAPALWFMGALAEGGAKLLGRPPAIGRFGATFISRSGDVSNERLREQLGWHPRVTVDEGIALSVGARNAGGSLPVKPRLE